MKRILFACVHSAGRSQMSAAFFNLLADPALAVAEPCGTEPGSRVHPEVVEVMAELGVDLSSARPQLLTSQLAERAALLITLGCNERCPVVPGLERRDWNLPDPKGQSPQRVREIRDQIRALVRALVEEKGWGRPSAPSGSSNV